MKIKMIMYSSYKFSEQNISPSGKGQNVDERHDLAEIKHQNSRRAWVKEVQQCSSERDKKRGRGRTNK